MITSESWYSPDLKVTVYTGPVFRENDKVYLDKFAIPAEFWKVMFSAVKSSASITVEAVRKVPMGLPSGPGTTLGLNCLVWSTSRMKVGVRKTSAGILKHQDPVSGLWWQVMDKGGQPGNYLEATASAMFVRPGGAEAIKEHADRQCA